MFFTRQGLEQATDATLASYKATRFPPGMACYDLCCGIGGDLLALGPRGEVVGVERDSVVACLAAANSQRLSPHTSRVLQQDVREIALEPDIAVHIDPDRRPAGRRTVRLARHEPPADVVQRLLAPRAAAALKLAPATDPDDPLLAGAELEWIGQQRECQQLVAWFGAAARNPGRRVATVLEATGTQPLAGRRRSRRAAASVRWRLAISIGAPRGRAGRRTGRPARAVNWIAAR